MNWLSTDVAFPLVAILCSENQQLPSACQHDGRPLLNVLSSVLSVDAGGVFGNSRSCLAIALFASRRLLPPSGAPSGHIWLCVDVCVCVCVCVHVCVCVCVCMLQSLTNTFLFYPSSSSLYISHPHSLSLFSLSPYLSPYLCISLSLSLSLFHSLCCLSAVRSSDFLYGLV